MITCHIQCTFDSGLRVDPQAYRPAVQPTTKTVLVSLLGTLHSWAANPTCLGFSFILQDAFPSEVISNFFAIDWDLCNCTCTGHVPNFAGAHYRRVGKMLITIVLFVCVQWVQIHSCNFAILPFSVQRCCNELRPEPYSVRAFHAQTGYRNWSSGTPNPWCNRSRMGRGTAGSSPGSTACRTRNR